MAIPKIIHYCWFGGAPLPDRLIRCIESWRKFCPDYKIIRWDESNFDYHKYQYTEQAYQAKKWAFVSDVARLDVVYEYGGFYLDTDVELIKSLDALTKEKAFMGFEKGRLVNTGLGFGSEKGNPAIKANLNEYLNKTFLRLDGSFDLTACPVVTTKCLESFGLQRRDVLQDLGVIKIFPTEYFAPMLLVGDHAEILSNTFSIHHYQGSWTTEKEKRGYQRRVKIYSKFGKKGLRIYDGIMVLKKQGIRAFFHRVVEIIRG